MKPRPVIQRFSEHMETVLEKHDAEKGTEGWLKDDVNVLWLFGRLQEEILELKAAIDDVNEINIKNEVADVANFAMMIWDRVSKNRRWQP